VYSYIISLKDMFRL